MTCAIAVSILADIALMSIPIMLFRTLKLPPKTKIGVIFLCCLGVLYVPFHFSRLPALDVTMLTILLTSSTCVCAIVKTALLPALFDDKEEDKTWSLAQLCLWAP